MLHIISILFQFIVSFIWWHDICTCTFSFILHIYWVSFWRSWICTFRLDVFFYWSGVHWDHTLRKDSEFSFIRFWYSYFSFIYIVSRFSLYHYQLLFHLCV